MEVYTRPIYLRFRTELQKVTSYNVNQVDGNSFDVVPIKGSVFGYGKQSYKVDTNFDTETYTCECCKFSRDGLLCCHIMRVMVQLDAIDYIPQQYILHRWRVPEEVVVVSKVELPKVSSNRKMNNKERQLLRYGTLCNDYTRVARIASTSDKGKALADKYMVALENELKAMKLSEAAKRKKRKQTSIVQGDAPEGEGEGDAGQGSSTRFANVEDPVVTTTKGRPGEKRKKSGLHLKPAKPVKCTLCGSTLHNAGSCSARITPGPEPKEIDFFRDMA
jgi:hypothetical protein